MQLSGVFMLQSTHWALRLADVLLVLCGIYNALMTMFSNPGYSDEIFRNLYIKRNGIRRPEPELNHRFCRHCEIVRTPHVEHCSMCGLCVHGIDHHCVFFGNCIARDNLSSFHASIGILMVSVIYFMILQMSDSMNSVSRVHHAPIRHNTTL